MDFFKSTRSDVISFVVDDGDLAAEAVVVGLKLFSLVESIKVGDEFKEHWIQTASDDAAEDPCKGVENEGKAIYIMMPRNTRRTSRERT